MSSKCSVQKTSLQPNELLKQVKRNYNEVKQLTQKLGSGEMLIQDVPLPQLGTGMILVKNHYSIISSGTEGSTVSTARKSLIAKAKERPQQVKQVIDTLKSQGPVNTYRAVTKKLDAYSPLGYSCSGEVIGIVKELLIFLSVI